MIESSPNWYRSCDEMKSEQKVHARIMIIPFVLEHDRQSHDDDDCQNECWEKNQIWWRKKGREEEQACLWGFLIWKRGEAWRRSPCMCVRANSLLLRKLVGLIYSPFTLRRGQKSPSLSLWHSFPPPCCCWKRVARRWSMPLAMHMLSTLCTNVYKWKILSLSPENPLEAGFLSRRRRMLSSSQSHVSSSVFPV